MTTNLLGRTVRGAALVLTAGLLVLLVAGCGSGSGSGSFVGEASNAAILIQWTQNGSKLSGSMQEALLQGTGTQEQASSQSQAFTGTLNGSSVTLSLNQGLGSVSNLTGTLRGADLDLDLPAQGGGVTTVEMASGGPSRFDADLSKLKREATRADDQAAQEQAAQQQADQVSSDAGAVSSDISNLKSAEQSTTGTGSVAGDLAQTQKDVNQTRADLDKVLAEKGHTDVDTLCSDADTVSSDADTVQSDDDTIIGDQDSSDGDTSSIGTAVKQLRQDQTTLDTDRQNYPGDVPADAPSDAQIARGINAAQKQIHSEGGTTGGAVSQAKQMVATANGYANQAQAACSASGG
jgi:hypothetical protein